MNNFKERPPVAIFVFNRLIHIKETISALKLNDGAQDTKLYIFSDGPRTDSDSVKVREVRKYLTTITGFFDVELIFQEKNRGLAASIIDGVTKVLNSHNRVIVLEDDLITSKHFLNYMRDGLEMYETDDKVCSIHAYTYPCRVDLPETFFMRGADCWGWATWKNSWQLFLNEPKLLLEQLQANRLEYEFDLYGTYPFLELLKDRIDQRNNSWAIIWHASAFIADKLTLYPGKSLVRNFGFDATGTHCDTNYNFEGKLSDQPISVVRIAQIENLFAKKEFAKFFFRIKTPSQKIRFILRKLFNFNLHKKFIKSFFSFFSFERYRRNHGNFGSGKFLLNNAKSAMSKYPHSGYSEVESVKRIYDLNANLKKHPLGYEKDGTIQSGLCYDWNLIAVLFEVSKYNDGKVEVLDFGGAFGRTFYKNEFFLKAIPNLTWQIVEQKDYVDMLTEEIHSGPIRFDFDLERVLTTRDHDVAIFFSSIQYAVDPNSVIKKILEKEPDYIIFTRTPVCITGKELYVTQQVFNNNIEYPAYILNYNTLLAVIEKKYTLIECKDDVEGTVSVESDKVKFVSLTFRRKSF